MISVNDNRAKSLLRDIGQVRFLSLFHFRRMGVISHCHSLVIMFTRVSSPRGRPLFSMCTSIHGSWEDRDHQANNISANSFF